MNTTPEKKIRQEKRKDVAVFVDMMKTMMNEPTPDAMSTLDRDLQHFLYGRIAVLVKHNNGQAIGSIADVGSVIGAALASVISEFTRGRPDQQERLTAFQTAKENMIQGFDIRSPKVELGTDEVHPRDVDLAEAGQE
jgi:hypothetical protein